MRLNGLREQAYKLTWSKGKDHSTLERKSKVKI